MNTKTMFFVFIAVFSMCLTQSITAKDKVIIATGEYTPFVSAALKHNGYVSHIIKKAFSFEGIDVEFRYLPWKRSYESTKAGDYDATSFWYESDERKKEFYYSDIVTHEKTVFFYRKDNPLKQWTTLSDLKGLSVGATIGYTYTKEFWDAATQGVFNLSKTSKDIGNMKKLVAGRIDIFPAGMVQGSTLLNKNFAPGIVSTIDFSETPLVSTTGHLLFPKSKESSKKLLAVFNKGLAKLKKSGELETMYNSLITGGYDKTP